MQAAKLFIYSNTVQIQILDVRWFNTRYRKVYSRPITVYQGIDNPVQVIIKNQQQKPVDLTDYGVIAEIQDPHVASSIHQFSVSWQDISTGRGYFTIPQSVVDSLEQRYYRLTFKTINQTTSALAPMYVDDNFGVPIDLRVLPAYYPTVI
jgi:hypothetical protein